MILYKRNANGKPVFWSVTIDDAKKCLNVSYGLVGKTGHTERLLTHRKLQDEYTSMIKAKRRDGYKEIKDLYDNAPILLHGDIIPYLNTYLPKFNTHEDGKFIPMLCKTLEDNKPFTKGSYFGEWKINGERCIITASKDNGLFEEIKLHYRSREGVDWTDKLSYMDSVILPCISSSILEMMIEEGVGLDGELYLPGYGINEINSFIKNVEVPQHYKLQFWCYDLCVENMSAGTRYDTLVQNFGNYQPHITTKEHHLRNENRFVLLPSVNVSDINEAIATRDLYIQLGFEGLVIRETSAEYQFGGKRNNSMLKFKKKEDGLFVIVDIIPEGLKRSHLPKFVLRNDINGELFECTINKPQKEQEQILIEKDKYLNGNYLAFVEYRERSGVNQLPFHAKVINLIKHES